MVPESALYVRLVMGTVVDYFKPVESSSWCEMLKSNTKHQWSATGVDGSWVTPDYVGSQPGHLGGSSVDWPLQKVEGDKRRHLSFWSDDVNLGGCCSTSTEIYSVGNWGVAFTLSFGVIDLPPPPPNTTLTLFAEASATTRHGGAYWDSRCAMVPESALYVRLVMGTVVDYFKPVENSSWCEMLKSYNKHEWSATGVDGSWVTPDYGSYIATSFFGGSSVDWPKQNVEGDKRRSLSFWWEASQSGGCCSASTGMYSMGWGNAFTLSYGAVPLSQIIGQLDKMSGRNEQLTAELKVLENQIAQVTRDMVVSKNLNQQLAAELKLSENRTEQLTADKGVLERLSVQLTEDLAAEKELHDACTAGCETTSGNGRTNKTKNAPNPNNEKQSCSNSAVGGLAGVIALLVVAVVYLLVRNHGNQKLLSEQAADSKTQVLRKKTVVVQAVADQLEAVVAGGDRSPALDDDDSLYENEEPEGNISQVVTIVDAVYAEPYEEQVGDKTDAMPECEFLINQHLTNKAEVTDVHEEPYEEVDTKLDGSQMTYT
jgi:hypothetical protein